MDSLSALDPLAWDPEFLKDHPAYAAGQALGCLYQGNKQAATSYPLSGRLYLSKTGWLLLSVPNALVRGVYDAMPTPGAELPTSAAMGVGEKSELLNAHITVMTGDEVTQVGADKINERGHMFGYTLGALKEIEPRSGSSLSKIWAIQVSAPLLSALRKSYGLSALPNDGEPFHITVAVRKRGVLLDNGKAKGYETPTDVNDGESFEHPISRGELKAALDNTAIDFDKWHGKAFKIVTTPPGKSVVSNTDATPIADAPGRVSIVTPENGDSWNWPAAPQETVNNFRSNWGNIQGGIGGYKMDQIRRGMGSAAAPVETAAQPIAKAAASELSRAGTKDRLHGGKADNIPDREFSPTSLSEGQEDEREHTDNDQVAKEIAKDHLSQDPQYYKKEKLIEQLPAKIASVYSQQLKNLANFREPIVYDQSKPVYQNVVDHVFKAKQRGDFILRSQQNAHNYKAMLDPRYRYQVAMQAVDGTLPQMDPLDKTVQMYGNDIFDTIGNLGKKKNG